MTGWRPGQPVVVETEHYRLRSLTDADATDVYVGWWNDPEIQASLGFPARNWTRAQAAAHIRKFNNRTSFHLGIFPRDRSEPVGFFTIFLESPQLARTNVVIGDKAFWGRKVVLEVREKAFDFVFETLGVEKIYGQVDARNFPAIFNYKAQGFTREGVLRKHTRAMDGTLHDIIMFGMLREEWRARQAAKPPQPEDRQP